MLENDFYELNRLTVKIDELIDKFLAANAECVQLRELNNSLNVQLQQSKIQIQELERKIDKLKLSGALLSGGENAIMANKKIDELVREIDKCVALLKA